MRRLRSYRRSRQAIPDGCLARRADVLGKKLGHTETRGNPKAAIEFFAKAYAATACEPRRWVVAFTCICDMLTKQTLRYIGKYVGLLASSPVSIEEISDSAF
jgi:hypothetical protein